MLTFKRKLVKRTACIHPIGEGEIPTQLQGWPGARLTALMEASCPLLARVSAPREEDAAHPTATQRADPGHTTNHTGAARGSYTVKRVCAPGSQGWICLACSNTSLVWQELKPLLPEKQALCPFPRWGGFLTGGPSLQEQGKEGNLQVGVLDAPACLGC